MDSAITRPPSGSSPAVTGTGEIPLGCDLARGVTGHLFTVDSERFAATYEPAPAPLVMPPDEFAALKAVADAAGTVSDDTGRALTTRHGQARERARASLPGCPTPCDDDCELNPDGCHQSHEPVHKRWHDPGWSCQMVQQAIAEAVSAERARAEAAEAKLAAITAHCRLRMNQPGRSA